MKKDNRIPRITFDKASKAFVLRAFGKTTDGEGYVIKQDTKQRVLTKEGEEIHIKEFAGIKQGSEIYLKKDLSTLLKLAKNEI